MFSDSGLVPADTGSVRFRRLRLIFLGTVVILAFAGSSAYDALRSYQETVAANHREIANVANALAEQTAWTLQAVDLLLQETANWYRNEGQGIAPERLEAVLAARAAGVQEVRQIAIVDREGNRRYGSQFPHSFDVSDRSYFIAQRDGTAQGLFMSEPIVTRSEGRTAVVLSRRIDDAQGQFAGVVSASLDLNDLQHYFQAANLGPDSAIELLRNDGTLLSRNPFTPDAVGKKLPTLLTPALAGPARLFNPIDGQVVLGALARVRNAPLTIVVTRDAASALAAWRAATIRVAVRTLVLTFLGAFALAALLRQIERATSSQEALRESEERYTLAMEAANEGHWDWHAGSDRMFMSAKMKTLYGFSAEAVIPTRSAWLATIVIHPDDRAGLETALRDHFEGRTPFYECEYRVRHPEGAWRWLRARGHVLRDAAGTPIRFVGTSGDITAQKRAQHDKEQLEAQLRQSHKMEAIGTLAGGIAHDFNNILGAILGYGELAQQHAASGSPLRRYLDNVLHAAERAKLLVERILGFSRSGLADRAPVHIQFVIEETLELLEASLPAGIRLETRIEAGNAAVIGDATDLHQVAMNLCTNAIQAMEHGGVLSVTLHCVEVTEQRLLARGLLVPGAYVRLTVGDTGVGIPPAGLERMFDPFFTTKGVGQGTGLGLSVVHGIVSDLGGVIEVTSTPGEGTRFEIWLPAAGEAALPAAEAPRPLERGHGETVMIVDDERALVALAEEITAELGYEPVGFDSSSAALAAFRATPQRFDAVLSDESMPDLAGTALALEIRRVRPSLPIILMSGYGGPQLTQRAAAAGVDEVLRKPLHRGDLAEALARVLAPAHCHRS